MVPKTIRFDFNLEKISKAAYQTTSEENKRKKITTGNNMKYSLPKHMAFIFTKL